MNHRHDALKKDQPIEALIRDSKSRGPFDETLIIWEREFGRTPMTQSVNGRNHQATGFSMRLAEGGIRAGIRAGITRGATDDPRIKPIENRLSVHDPQATLLHRMGMNHEQRSTETHVGTFDSRMSVATSLTTSSRDRDLI